MSHCRAGAQLLPHLACLAAFILTPVLGHSQALTLVQSTTRYAGTGTAGYSSDYAPATTVLLNGPSYIAFDSNGNQYLSDTLNNCVRKIDTSGQMSTVVGLHVPNEGDTCSTVANPDPTAALGLYHPTGIAIDSANNLYISDSGHNCVRKLAALSTGVSSLTTVAGSCGATTTASTTPNPNGLAVDSSNNLYISIQDTEVNPAASVYQVLEKSSTSLCVLAGATSTQVPTPCNAISAAAQLNTPSGLAINVLGNLFIADTGNNCVREIVNMHSIQTVVGQCANDSTGSVKTALSQPYGLAFSPTQSLLITEANPGAASATANDVYNYVLGKTSLTLIAGLPNGAFGSYSTTQEGQSALNVPLNNPRGIAADSTGNIYIADYSNNVARKLSNNVLFPSTPVGNASASFPITFAINQSVNLSLALNPDFTITSNTCNGSQSPASAGNAPTTCQAIVSFTPTRAGLRSAALHLTDSISNTTVLQGVQGIATGAFGAFTPGTANTADQSLNEPSAVTVDSFGNIYVLEQGLSAADADLIMIPAGGGTPETIIPKGAGLVTPSAIAIDSVGNYFIADSGQGTVSRFGADGSINTTYITGLDTPTAIFVDSFDNLYIAEAGATHSVIESYASGIRRTISSNFVQPMGLFIDNNGILYVADAGGHYVYGIDKSGTQHVIAGNGTSTDSNTGQATGTALISPTSLTVDAAGDIYISDPGASRVYTVYVSTTSNGTNIATVLGTGTPGYTGDGGPANAAEISKPSSIALDSSNNLYVVDLGNMVLRSVTYPPPTVTFPSTLVNQSSAVILQSIANFGSSNLNLTSAYTISNPQFTLDPATTTCGTTILSGATCNLGLIFTPTAPGQVTGTLTVTSNASDSPETLNLVGNGQPIAPPAFTFPQEVETYGQPFPEGVNLPTSGPAPTGTVTFSYNGKVLCTTNGSPLPGVCNALNSGLSVGSYPVTVTYSGDSNYTGSTNTVTLSVIPAQLILNVNSATRPYDTPNPTLTGTLTGVVPGDNIQVSYATTATLTSAPGQYPITGTLTAVSPTLLSNYTITNNPGTLTITTVTVTIQVLNQTRVYGSPNPTFTATVTGANGNTIQITYTSTATLTSPVGSYPITATVTGGIDTQDFTPTILPGTLTVTPAPLTVVVANASKNVGDPNPTFSATITGALNGDTFTNNLTTTATASSPAGTYPINDALTGANASDYTITVTPGTLTINGTTSGGGTGTGPGGGGTGTGSTTVNTTTAVTTSLSPAPEGTNITFTATVTAASGTPTGTVSFLDGTIPLGTGTLDGTGTATFSTTTLTIGTHTINATYVPTGDFNASSGSVTEIIAALGSFTVSATPPTQYLKGAGTVTYQVTVTSVGGFAGQVALACSGLPADATCSFGSNPTLTAGASQTTPMTVTLTANDAMLRLPSGGLAPIAMAISLPFEITSLSVLFAGIGRRKRLPGRLKLLAIIIATLSTVTLAGCGCPPTVYQTYTVTITGTSPGATTQTTTVVLAAGN